jgi:hypothetical protein
MSDDSRRRSDKLLISIAELLLKLTSSTSQSKTPRTGDGDKKEGDDIEPPELQTPESPLTREVHSVKTIDIKIWQSENLTDEHGRAPEHTIAANLAGAMERSFINYNIEFGFETQTPPSEDVRGETPGWWRSKRENDEIDQAEHSNLLLLNHIGGGGTYGISSVVGCGRISEYIPHQRYGRGGAHGNIHAALHEVMHNRDLSHDMEENKEGKQHPGLGWNEDNEWYYTPSNSGNDADNACGEYIPERENDDRVFVHAYTPCFREMIDIKQ